VIELENVENEKAKIEADALGDHVECARRLRNDLSRG
jgi:hypothetical protein